MTEAKNTSGGGRRKPPGRNEADVMVEELLGERPIGYSPGLAKALGSPIAALFLHELFHWRKYSEDGWVFRTQEEIYETTAIKRKAQEGARTMLRGYGVVEERRRGVPARLHYYVHVDVLKLGLLEGFTTNPQPPLQNVPSDNQEGTDGQTSMDDATDKDVASDGLSIHTPASTPASTPATRSGAGAPDDAAKPGQLSQQATKRLYDRILAEQGWRFTSKQYGWCIGQFTLIQGEPDNATWPELVAVVARMVDTLPQFKAGLNAYGPQEALQDVRREAAGSGPRGGTGASPTRRGGQGQVVELSGERARKRRVEGYEEFFGTPTTPDAERQDSLRYLYDALRRAFATGGVDELNTARKSVQGNLGGWPGITEEDVVEAAERMATGEATNDEEENGG